MKKFWKFFIPCALLAGLILRLLWSEDMEYKEDEEFNFTQAHLIGNLGGHPWPWTGMPSGVYIPNPGMSVWVFAALAKLCRATDPVSLNRAVSLFAIFGMSLLIPFAFRFFKEERDREPWLWAFALGMVNPIAVLYQRKLWPEPFLPFFTVTLLMGYFRRELFWGAFVWGLMGALSGQVHMSGFFLAAGFALWTLLFDRKRPRWTGWFAGSALGALPLIPWASYVLAHPSQYQPGSFPSVLQEAVQLRYWVFWITNSLGLHLGNALGLLRGESNLQQLADFIRYPLVAGHATYLVGLAHVAALAAAAAILLRWRPRLKPDSSGLAVGSGFYAAGILMTLTGVNIRRYYLSVCFPLEFVWLANSASRGPRARTWLLALWISQLMMSAGFVWYVHTNHGSTQGDYGVGYKNLMQERTNFGPPPPPAFPAH